jgi:drug/metabolite transporter (DMT)-like permease
LTSLCFANSRLLSQRGYHQGPAPWGAWITIAGNCVFLLAGHFLLESSTRLLVVDNLIFVVVGLLVPGATRVLSFRGIRTMGSAVTSTIINTTPMFSTVLAVLVLGERPGPLVLLGVALTVAGLITVSWVGRQATFKNIELIYPFSCALIFSLKDVPVRWGLTAGAGQPVLAAGIAALTSTITIFFKTRWFQREKFVLPPAKILWWFVWSGIFTGGSFLFMYVALSMERVTIVAPLFNSYAIFVLLLTPFMARRIESITWRKVAGAALVVAGIFLVSIGKD